MGQETDVIYEFPPGETPDEGHPRGSPSHGERSHRDFAATWARGWRQLATDCSHEHFRTVPIVSRMAFARLPVHQTSNHDRNFPHECTRRAFAAKRGIPHDTPDPDALETARSGRLPRPGHPAIRPLLCHSPSFALTHRHVAATIPEGPRTQSHAKQGAGRTQWIRPAPAVVALLALPAIGWRTSSDSSPGRRPRSRARPTRGCRGTSGWS